MTSRISHVYVPTREHPRGAPPIGDGWAEQAACRPGSGVDPEVFFPISEGRFSRPQEHEAKLICWECPAATDCLRWALRSGQAYGIAGGLTDRERRALSRRILM